MTKREVGRFYRALLYKDGWFELSKNLSDDAAYDLYKELERFGFDYYSERYKNASLDETNGFKAEMDKLKNLFNNRSKYLLEMSGKNSGYIKDNYEKFAEYLLNYCASHRVKNIHELLNSNDNSLEQALEDFENNNEVNDMSSNDENKEQNKKMVVISTPLEFMRAIEKTIRKYDDYLNSPDYTDEKKEKIRFNKDAHIDELNSMFLVFLDNYSKNLLEVALVTPLDDKEKLDAEIASITSIYREYFHDNVLADDLQREYDNTFANVSNLDSELSQDVNSEQDEEEIEESSILPIQEESNTVSSESIDESNKVNDIMTLLDKTLHMIGNETVFFDSDNLDGEIKYLNDIIEKIEILKTEIVDEDVLKEIRNKEDSILEFISVLEDRKIFRSDDSIIPGTYYDSFEAYEKEYDRIDDNNESQNSNKIEDVFEDDVIEELDSVDVSDDYSILSNDELLDKVNNLVSEIRKAQLENSNNLRDLLSEAARVQAELDSRLTFEEQLTTDKSDDLILDDDVDFDKINRSKHFTQEDKDRMISNEIEADKIRRSKHFTQEDKDRMIEELYAEDNSYGEVSSSIRR